MGKERGQTTSLFRDRRFPLFERAGRWWGKRVGGSAYWRIGVWEVRLLFDPYESRYGRFETTVYRKRYFGQQQRYRCTLEGGLVNRNIVNNSLRRAI